MWKGADDYLLELLADEHRRILNRKQTDYTAGREKGVIKAAHLIKKYWPDLDALDYLFYTLYTKAVKVPSEISVGFIRSISRCQHLMWYVAGDVMDIEFPTQKQLYLIKVTENSDPEIPEFSGITKEDASAYISYFSDKRV